MTDRDLLQADLDLLWLRDGHGRMLRARTPEPRPAPWLVVGTTLEGRDRVWAAAAEVPDPVRDRVAAVLDGPPPAPTGPVGATPADADQLLAALGPPGEIEVGRAYVLDGPPPSPVLPADAEMRTHRDPDAAATLALLPEEDQDLTAPWAVVVVAGEAAAVCMSARVTAGRAAAGVWTYEAHRRRGLATAATAAWAAMVDGTPHYGHHVENEASARVAAALGFRPIGGWWWVRPPEEQEEQEVG